MNYKGYELRNDAVTKFYKDGEVIEVKAWGIYRNGDYRGSAKTLDAAKQHIDGLTKGTLYRPPDRTHVIQKAEYSTHGTLMRTKIYREG